MRRLLRELSESVNDSIPIIIAVTWLLVVIILVKLLITGAIR